MKHDTIERLVLFNPEITTETVNGLLVRKNGKVKGFGNAVSVDCYFEDQKTLDKRLLTIRGSFPKGIEKVGVTISVKPFPTTHLKTCRTLKRILNLSKMTILVNPFIAVNC